jgi:hypothetical protein
MSNKGSGDKPPEHRRMSVGQEVRIGNLDWSAILEVCDDHLFYKVLTVTAYNQSKGVEFRIWYVHWTDCMPIQDDPAAIPSMRRNEDIRISYQQRDVRALLSMYHTSSGLDLDPNYQRGHVWSDDQKVSLIDSIFRNVDIGKFTVIRRPFSEELDCYYEMLDGKQRTQALIEFYQDGFKYRGRYYSELHPFDRYHFKGYNISYAETEPLTRSQKYRYFLILNTAGTPMSEGHLDKVRDMLATETTRASGVDGE